MRVAVVGGGIIGLTAGYRLSSLGHQVTVFEKNSCLGGLAAGFKQERWSWNLEHFFHHLFTSDTAVKNLISELGLSKNLFYTQPKTSIFKDGAIFQFDSPLSLLKFPGLSLTDKLRTGLVTAYLKIKTVSQKDTSGVSADFTSEVGFGSVSKFEKITAEDWLKKYYGASAYETLWRPLLEKKFGPFASQISMVWFWARIKKRSRRLGYLQGGFQLLIDKLALKIKEDKGKIILNKEIKNLDEIYHYRNTKFDKIIVTVSLPQFLKIAPQLPQDYKDKLSRLHFVGALNLILVLKEKFLKDGTYWLNINEKDFPFVAVVEHTNFIDSQYYGNNYIVYVGGYYSQNHRYFKLKKEKIFQEFLPYLKRINPQFNFQFSIFNFQLASSRFAQPVVPKDYSKIIPSMRTPLKNVYLANQSLIYPWDRGLNYAVEIGEKAAKEI